MWFLRFLKFYPVYFNITVPVHCYQYSGNPVNILIYFSGIKNLLVANRFRHHREEDNIDPGHLVSI